MVIAFSCPHCGEPYKLKDELAGKTAKCKKPECRKVITVPQPTPAPKASVAPAGSAAPAAADAEALAAAAFADEPPAPEETAPKPQIKVTCANCSFEYEVDRALEGKNTRCPDCGKIFRVPKLVEDKPADWRNVNDGKPSLAKRDVPKLEGATEAASYANVESLKKAGAFDVEEEEEPEDRRRRRIKTAIYGVLAVAVLTGAIVAFIRWRGSNKIERWMEMAVKEIEDKEQGSKRPEFHAAIHRYAGEYYVRAANGREDLDVATNHFKQALGKLQTLPTTNVDRNAMLLDLCAAMTVLGGDGDQVKDAKRQSWQDVQRLIQQPLERTVGSDPDLRDHGIRKLVRAFAAKQQTALIFNVARYAYPGEEAECAGRIGLELLLLNDKESAEAILKKAPPGDAPALTALKLVFQPTLQTSADNPLTPLPPKKGPPSLASRLAHVEALAYQGKIQEARELAERPAPKTQPVDRLRALLLLANVTLEINKDDELTATLLNSIVDGAIGIPKDTRPSWLLVRVVDIAAKAGKNEITQRALEAISDDRIRAWGMLAMLRQRIAANDKAKADDSWLETITDPAQASLPQALSYAEIARQNAMAGESSYAKIVETWPKGTLRPFGYAGTALGAQDRRLKP